MEILSLSQLVWYVGVKKEMYTTRNLQYFVHKLQCILHTYYAKLQMLLQKATDCTTNNYTKLQTKITYTSNTYKLSKLHTKLTH